MNDKCPLCGISVNEDRRETCEVLLSANESGGALEGLLNLVHVHCVRAMIKTATRKHLKEAAEVDEDENGGCIHISYSEQAGGFVICDYCGEDITSEIFRSGA